jgi:hypothetical protein
MDDIQSLYIIYVNLYIQLLRLLRIIEMMPLRVSEMEKEEKNREKVLVPVRRHETTNKKEHAEGKNKTRDWKMPRNWHIY